MIALNNIYKHINVSILCFIILIILNSCVDKDSDKTQKSINKLEQEKELTLIMAGDALLHSHVYKDAQHMITQDNKQNQITYNFNKMFNNIKSIIQNYDLAFYNQETILGGKELGLSSYPSFNSPQEFGDCMIDLGFNIVSLANNHTLDRGEKAIQSSLKYWENKPALTAGSYKSFEDRNTPRIYKKNDIKYTMLAYTYGTNGIKIPKNKEYLVNVYNKDMLKDDIAKIRDKVDLLIVSMHWGNEYQFLPSKEQEEFAKFLAEQNVDIIIGNHPHVIQPIEWINNTLVIYSLGNMISAQKGLERRIGMLVGIKIKKDSKTNLIKLTDLHANLIYTYYDELMQNFSIYPFSKLNDNILPNYKNIHEDYIKIIKQRDIKDTIKISNIK